MTCAVALVAGIGLVVAGFAVEDKETARVLWIAGAAAAALAYMGLTFLSFAMDRRRRALRPDGVCPNCGSPSISALKSDYDLGLGCCGTILLGPFGILCGLLGSNEVRVHCLNCNHSWPA